MFRIFLSSPGDVETERNATERVVARINAEHSAPVFETIRWEDNYYTADSTFQTQIPKPSACDLVVCIFWKRLGSDLPDSFRRPDGSLPTGTEYEFEEALQHAAGSPERLPDILVYRNTAEVLFSERTHEFEKAQRDRFLAFWRRWFHNEQGHFVAGFQNYEGTQQFERLFEQHLRQWLSRRTGSVTWKRGSPFRGLNSFDIEHAPIFFGRSRESDRVRARFLANALGGNRFLLIVGGSGTGKSSLVRAGLFARLAQPGGMGDLAGFVRVATLTPSGLHAAGSDNWARGLASALFDERVLGSGLRSGDFNTPALLADLLGNGGASAAAPLGRALERLRDIDPDVARTAGAAPGALLILLDQLEELFSWEESKARRFLELIQALVGAGQFYVVGTMRSDFWSRLADLPELEQLAGTRTPLGPGQHERFLNIAPPERADIREIVTGPATAAGLRYEQDGELDLADLIEHEADVNALPALQMLLAELYERRREDTLQIAAYRELGGVAGVMAARGEEVLRSAGPGADEAFAKLARLLVSAGPANEPAVAARLPFDALTSDAERQLATALRDASLLTSHDGVLMLAHESLIKGWDRLAQRVDEERRLFEVRDRISAMCRLYLDAPENGRRQRLLQGFALAEATDLLAKWGPETLAARFPELPDFIRASQAQARSARRKKIAGIATVSSALAAMVLAVVWFQVQSKAAEKEARLQFLAAQTQAALRQGDRDKAVLSAGEALSLDDSPLTRSAALAALMEHSPYLEAVVQGSHRDAVWTGDRDIALFDQHANALSLQPGKATQIATPEEWRQHRYVGFWAKGQTGFYTLRQDGAFGFLPAGNEAGALTTPPTGGSYVLPLQSDLHADAASVTVAVADLFNGTILRHCDMSLQCTQTALEGAAAGAAFSPDGRHLAVIREEVGKAFLQLFETNEDLNEPAAQADLSDIASIDGFRAMAWSPDGGTLAIGTAAGKLALFEWDGWKAGRNVQASDSAILSLAWSQDGGRLAYACNGKSICITHMPDGATRVLRGAQGTIGRLSWPPDGRLLASVELSGTVRLWQPVSAVPVLATLDIDTRPELTAIATDPASGRIVAGDADGSLWLIEVGDSTGPLHVPPRPGAGSVQNIALSPDGIIAAAYGNGYVSLLQGDGTPIRNEATNPDRQRIAWAGDRVAAIGEDGGIMLIPSSGPAEHRELQADHEARPVDGLLGLPDGGLITSHIGGAIGKWEPGKGLSELVSAEEVGDPFSALSLAIDLSGHWLAATRSDDMLKIYDLQRKREPVILPLYGSNTKTVAFSPDGKRFAALGADATLYAWEFDADTGAFSNQIAVPAVPQAVAEDEKAGRLRPASWMEWAGPDRLAIAAAAGSVLIVNLDRSAWNHRLSELRTLDSPADTLKRLSP